MIAFKSSRRIRSDPGGTAVVSAAPKEPEIRRAEPVRPEDLAKAGVTENATESGGPNQVAIKPLKKTYIKVVVDDEAVRPAFERWISPADGIVEFRGHLAPSAHCWLDEVDLGR